MAQLLNLHQLDRGSNPPSIFPTIMQPPQDWCELEERRRTWWVAYVSDRLLFATSGLPALIDDHDASFAPDTVRMWILTAFSRCLRYCLRLKRPFRMDPLSPRPHCVTLCGKSTQLLRLMVLGSWRRRYSTKPPRQHPSQTGTIKMTESIASSYKASTTAYQLWQTCSLPTSNCHRTQHANTPSLSTS